MRHQGRPDPLTDQMEITEWDPGRAMGVRHTGVVTGTGRFTARRRSTSTAAPGSRGREDLRFPWYLGGPIAGDDRRQWVLRRIWQRNLRALERLVEQSD